MMKYLLIFGNSFFNFIILDITVLNPTTHDANFWIGASGAFLSGFGLSVMRDLRKNTYTFRTSLINFITGLCLGYVAYTIQPDLTPSIQLAYYLFICALSGVYIVDLFEKSFRVALVTYFQTLLGTLLANLGKNIAVQEPTPENDKDKKTEEK